MRERENGARGLTATDVGGKLACVLIELHPREWRQTERRWGGAEGGWWCLVVIINVCRRTKNGGGRPRCGQNEMV